MYIHRYFNAITLLLFLGLFFFLRKVFLFWEICPAFWPFILFSCWLIAQSKCLLGWCLGLGFFPTAAAFTCPCLPFVFEYLTYCYFRKNNNFILVSDWSIALLCKVKLLGLEHEYEGGVAVDSNSVKCWRSGGV